MIKMLKVQILNLMHQQREVTRKLEAASPCTEWYISLTSHSSVESRVGFKLLPHQGKQLVHFDEPNGVSGRLVLGILILAMEGVVVEVMIVREAQNISFHDCT